MGIFSRKKKPSPALGTLPSPAPSYATMVPSAPSSPNPQTPSPVFKPQSTIQVALDPAPVNDENALFTITLDQDSDVAALREAISTKIGVTSFSLFKVAVPILAHQQSIEYRTKYSTSVNLLTSFPSFNLDDARQWKNSMGMAWSGSPSEPRTDLRMIDWFPKVALTDVISVLVRTSESSSSDIPLTFVSHFAPLEPFSSLSRFNAAAKSQSSPTVVTVDRRQTVRDLKLAILRADGREVKEELLERVVLWRVEMSEEEMIVIGERGGLKNGRMPWPYPPGAPVPVALAEDSLSVEHYFPNVTSTPLMITISVWLDSRACVEMPRPSHITPQTPAFKYPMNFAEPTAETPSQSRRSRQRPSTAPAVVVSTPGDINSSAPTFGSRSLSSARGARTPDPNAPPTRPRVASPLSTASMPATIQRGLGINTNGPVLNSSPMGFTVSPTTITRSNTLPRGSISLSECSSTDENQLPSLSFSQLSLTVDSDGNDGLSPTTPDTTDKADFDWSRSHKHASDVKGFSSLRSKFAHQGGRRYAI